MKHLLPFLAAIFVLSATTACSSVARRDVWISGDEGYHTYRIPSLLKAGNGDLLAFCEGRKDSGADAGNIDLLMKRSKDGGKTWSRQRVLWDDGENTCGNPCPVLDQKTGELLLLLSHNPGLAKEDAIQKKKSVGTRTVWIMKSKDDGETWAGPLEITSSSKAGDWGWYATGPGVGIQVQDGPLAGRLVIPCDHTYTDGANKRRYGSHAIYSDDHGLTWKYSQTIRHDMNECQVVELFDGKGTLLMDLRSYRGKACRAQSLSNDGGATWSEPVDVPVLVEPVCQASILRWAGPKGNWLLFSNPANEKKRVDLTIRSSDDNGKTWTGKLVVHPGPTAYSCLVAIDDEQAASLYESGVKRSYERITFASFTRADVAPSK